MFWILISVCVSVLVTLVVVVWLLRRWSSSLASDLREELDACEWAIDESLASIRGLPVYPMRRMADAKLDELAELIKRS